MASPPPTSGPRLNDAQRAAVEHGGGPLLVLAGAGSGKTRVITHRIARLLNQGVRPESILAVSFTNKAAAEMAERMAHLVGKSAADKLWLSTFHSFGVRFLGEEGVTASAVSQSKGVSDAKKRERVRGQTEDKHRFVIFDQGDSLGLIRELMRRGGVSVDRKLDPAALLSRISLWKNKFMSPERIDPKEVEYDVAAAALFPEYEARLRAMHAVDFDDLVVRPVLMLQANEGLQRKWQKRFQYLLVDEFQDTNRAQLELVRLLTNEARNICVVGDDDQSIYGWRGADVGNILDFEKHFPGAAVVKLEDNYRSRQPIIEVANRAISLGTSQRHRKTLRAFRVGGDSVRMSVVETQELEAKFVAREIRDMIQEGKRYADIAVLYRSNLQARLIEEELRVEGIPYRLFGGTVFFDRKEVKDAAAYLRVVVNPFDDLSARRVVNYPPRGIGETSLERIAEYAKAKGMPLIRALGHADAIPDLPAAARRGALDVFGMVESARKRMHAGGGIAETASSLFTAAGIEGELAGGGDGGPQAQRRLDNLKFLVSALSRYETSDRPDKPSLATFLHQITMRVDQEEEEDAGNKVTLSTLHGAKGLEWSAVFLIGLVEGQLPHGRTMDPKITEASPTDVEEERRLFYVGVTRARDRLYLTRPRQRAMRGKVGPAIPSRFLEGLPEEFIAEYTRPDRDVLEGTEATDQLKSILADLQKYATPKAPA